MDIGRGYAQTFDDAVRVNQDMCFIAISTGLAFGNPVCVGITGLLNHDFAFLIGWDSGLFVVSGRLGLDGDLLAWPGMGCHQRGINHFTMFDLQTQSMKFVHDTLKDTVKQPRFGKAVPPASDRGMIRLAFGYTELAEDHEDQIGTEIELHFRVGQVVP